MHIFFREREEVKSTYQYIMSYIYKWYVSFRFRVLTDILLQKEKSRNLYLVCMSEGNY